MNKIIEIVLRSKPSQLVRTALRDAREMEISSMAASLAYTTVLSIVPLLAVVYAVFAKLGGLKYVYSKLQPVIIQTLSEGAGETARKNLEHFVSNTHSKGLGWVGFAGLMITAITTYTTIAKAFHRIWDMRRVAPFVKRTMKVLTLILASPLLLLLSLTLTTALATHISIIPWAAQLGAFLVSYVLFLMLYSFVPSTRLPTPTLLKGAILPAVLWELTKAGFAIYTTRVVKYSNIYGSLAAVPLFLLWIFLAWYIALFGAVWIRSMQKNEARGFFAR